MSSQDKIKKVSKKAVKTPLVGEDSDDDCEMNQIRRSKPKSKVAENLFLDYESVEENPGEQEQFEAVGEQEIDYVASDVEEQDEGENTEQNEDELPADEREKEGKEEAEEGREENEGCGGEDDDEEEQEVKEILPCFLCKSDMKIVTKDGQQMLYCSAGAAVCTPPFTTPATYLALREMSKAVHPNYMHATKGTLPRCHNHNIPMALSFCNSSSEKFAHRPVFKCAVRAGKILLKTKRIVVL